MQTSGLVITLSMNAAEAAKAMTALSARQEFAFGERNDRWLPLVMETSGDAESHELHNWIQGLPGVEFVDVAYVNFDEVTHED